MTHVVRHCCSVATDSVSPLQGTAQQGRPSPSLRPSRRAAPRPPASIQQPLALPSPTALVRRPARSRGFASASSSHRLDASRPPRHLQRASRKGRVERPTGRQHTPIRRHPDSARSVGTTGSVRCFPTHHHHSLAVPALLLCWRTPSRSARSAALSLTVTARASPSPEAASAAATAIAAVIAIAAVWRRRVRTKARPPARTNADAVYYGCGTAVLGEAPVRGCAGDCCNSVRTQY